MIIKLMIVGILFSCNNNTNNFKFTVHLVNLPKNYIIMYLMLLYIDYYKKIVICYIVY